MTNSKNTKSTKEPEIKMVLSVTSKKEGFRRCGVAHSESETLYDPAAEDFPFSEGDYEVMSAEPMLIVSIRDVPVEDKASD